MAISSRTAQDPRILVQRNSVRYRCLTPSPAQALLFGNGHIGVSMHTPADALYLLISRVDIWNGQNTMGAMGAVRISGNTGLFTDACAVYHESDMYRAQVTVQLDTATGPVTFTLCCLRGQDVIVVDIADARRERFPFTVTLENWHAGEYIEAPDNRTLLTTHVTRDSVFPSYNRRVGVDAAAIGVLDPLLGRAWGLFLRTESDATVNSDSLQLPADEQHRVVIAAVCQPPCAGVDGEALVRSDGLRLATADTDTIAAWQQAHAAYWEEFWAQSYLSLSSGTGDAEYEERLWYTALYTIACGSGGALPMRFNGGPFLLEKDLRGWDGGYWFQNMRELYWPLLASGHWEFMRGFFQMYFDACPFVRAQTKRLHGIDALSFKETQTMWGADANTDVTQPGDAQSGEPFATSAVTFRYFSGNLECCLLMDWYVRASGDESFCRQEFYPFLTEILEFYLQYANKEEDGKYHLAPVNLLETFVNCKDDMPDLCGLHYFLPRAISWGTAWGEDPALLARWLEFADHLVPLPVGRWTTKRKYESGIHGEEYVVACELDPEGVLLPGGGVPAPTRRGNMENPELYAIFPWGCIGIDSPAREQRRAEESWHHRTWRYINSGWSQDVPQLARLGWGEMAKAASLEHASFHQRFPNGCFISPAGAHFNGLLTSTPFFDSAGVHATGINEMLLQSYDDSIRLTPATSVEWSGAYRLHAFGGFIVEVDFMHGAPINAHITATRPARLRVRNYRREVMVVTLNGVETRVSHHELFDSEVAPGDVASFTWEGVEDASIPVESTRPDVVYPGYKVRPPHIAQATGHWHDERKGHGQIGLAEDGLFPATR